MPLSGHRAIEGALGLALVIVPIVLGFAPVAIIVCMAFGLVIATLGFAANREGRALPPSARRVLDAVLVVGLIVAAALLYVLADERGATLLLAVGTVVMAALILFTRYGSGSDVEGANPTTVTSDSGGREGSESG